MKNENQSKKQSKKSKLAQAVAIVALIVLGSCDDFLTIEPRETISDELAIVDKTSLNTALRGAYRSLGDGGYYGGTYVLLGFVPSGNIEYQVFNNLQDLNFLPEDGSFQSAWSGIYKTINIANHIIAKAPDIIDVNLTAQDKDRILGEAHFIRALAYFDLARAFGGVPLKLSPTLDINEDGNVSRSSVAETYAQVLSDLQSAEGLLPAAVNRIRANQHTVRALRARYHLYNQEWNEAVTYASSVIDLSSQYKLIAPFDGWFKNGVIQTNESILEIAFSPQNTNGLRTPMSLLSRGGEYRFRPTNEVVDALKKSSFGGARLALLDSTKQSNTTSYAGSLYYRSPATDPSYILRIAEQYLIRAEAKAQLDDLTGAAEDLNAVRSRANLAPIEAISKEQILDAILDERRFEFLWEAHRYFDLVRTGKLKQEIELLKPNLTITPKLNVFPIPSNEVILGGLTQNSGY
jgi:tetratricopeptide (TPR) repeat protein